MPPSVKFLTFSFFGGFLNRRFFFLSFFSLLFILPSCASKKKVDVAITAPQKKIKHDDLLFRFMEASLEGLEGRSAEALKTLTQLVEEHPESSFFHFQKARVQDRKEHTSELQS